MLPPLVWPGDWSADDMRAIAGFILYFRAGMLRALESSMDPAYDQIPATAVGQRRYYQHAEAITRLLLSYTPYPVAKGELWKPGTQYYPSWSDPARGAG